MRPLAIVAAKTSAELSLGRFAPMACVDVDVDIDDDDDDDADVAEEVKEGTARGGRADAVEGSEGKLSAGAASVGAASVTSGADVVYMML
jgi:hypothetical protein